MNKLSYLIEPVKTSDGYSDIEYTGYFYVVDGKKLVFEGDFNPLRAFEVLEDELDWVDNKNEMVILCSCYCGYWECDSYVARVLEQDDIIKWEIHRVRSEINEPETYTFDKTQYESVMNEIRAKTREEEKERLDKKNKNNNL